MSAEQRGVVLEQAAAALREQRARRYGLMNELGMTSAEAARVLTMRTLRDLGLSIKRAQRVAAALEVIRLAEGR